MNNKISSDIPGSRLRKRWLLILFATVFAGIGLGFLLLGVIPTIWESRQMQTWEQRYARLLDAGVKTYSGDDSDTYRAYADYTYQFNGREYRGERVGIISMSDNIGNFHQTVGAELQRAMGEGELVPVWINPSDPGQAVLNRDLRWGMILFQMVFVLVFGGVGISLLLFCLLKPTSKIPDAALANTDVVSQPWLSDPNWASPVINSDAKSSAWGIWLFTGLWNLIALPAGVVVFPEVMDGNYTAALVVVFPLVGIGLLVWAIRTSMGWRRFGKTPLAMDPFPGAIGGQVGGTVDIALPYLHDRVFNATLSCLYSYMSGTGDDRRRRERVIWQSEGIAQNKSSSRGTRLEVLFDVDDKLPQSDSRENSRYHLWRLNIRCALPGVDFDRNFEIPVFPTAQESKILRHLSTDHHLAADHRKQEIEAVLNMNHIPGGIEIYYPAFRKPLGKLMGFAFGVIFFAVGTFIHSLGAPIIFSLVFGLLGGLVAVGSLYSLMVGLHVVVDQQYLRTVKNILGIPLAANGSPGKTSNT